METVTTTQYKCQTCGQLFGAPEDAKECEAHPITECKGVIVGDKVRIITGEGRGIATVTQRYIIKKSWGHYAWKRYWHTVGLVADCVSGGTRQLTFDDYDVV